jgi:hypothetical protein
MATFGGAQPIVTDGLVFAVDAANYQSYPGSGTTWSNLSGNGNNGTLVNGPTFDSGNGGSIAFDGSDDYINTNFKSISGTNSRTFSIWFNPDILQNKNILGYGNLTNHRMWDIILYQGYVGIHLYNSQAEAKTEYFVGKWQNITFTYTHPTIYSYMNGEYKNSYTNNTINTGEDYDLTIAKGVFNSYFYFKGKISTISIYNRTLSSSEITQNYNALKGRFGL